MLFALASIAACTVAPRAPQDNVVVDVPQDSARPIPQRLLGISADVAIIAELEVEARSYINAAWVERISTDAVGMYFRWPGVDGLVDFYRATGNVEYIDLSVAMSKRYIDQGKDIDGDGYLDWLSSWIDGYSHVHVEFRAADGIAQVAEAIHADPALSVRYESELSLFTQYLEKDVWEKDEASGYSTQNFLKSNVTHFIGRVGLVAVPLYRITGKKKYLDWIQDRGSKLRNALVLGDNGGYTFNCYLSGSSCSQGLIIDTSHAGDTVNFIVAAYELGLVFDGVDVQRLAETVKKNLWDQSQSNPRFNDRIDGSGEYGTQGENQGGWVKLAAYDEELRSLYRSWIPTGKPQPNPSAFSTTQLNQIHILGNLAAAYSD